ncbi:oligosaccharide flippase family protein [Dyella sp.]|uniref:lipopolysaccharide biosynthesis protein n=1 Tax=Dyella sp. TaxID=1869338 RepID=UPI002FD8F9B7
MRLGWNLIAALGNSGASALINVLATPFYLHFLGTEAYGLIGFFTTLMTLLAMLDLGLAPTISREVARQVELGDTRSAASLLATLERIYVVVAVGVGLLFLIGANWIAHSWLRTNHLSPIDVAHAVMIMGILAASRWPLTLYSGTLLGAQRLILLSKANITMVAIGALGSVALLRWVSPTINVFFLWQAVVSLIYTTLMRRHAWNVIGYKGNSRFEISELKRIWRFSVGLGTHTMTGAMLMQADKLALSKLVPLNIYGRYALASLLAGGLYLLVMPTYNVLSPRFSALVAAGEDVRLLNLYRLSTRLLATLVFPVAMVVALYAQPLVRVWTHDADLAAQVAPVLTLLIIGSALHGVMFMPYALQLAYGNARLPLLINSLLLVIYMPLIIAFTLRYAEIGTAAAWLILHIFYVVVGAWLTHRYYLKHYAWRWVLKDVSIPVVSALSVGMAFLYFFGKSALAEASLPMLILGICVSGVGAVAISLAFSPMLRSALLSHFNPRHL